MSEGGRWIPTDPAVRAGLYTSISDVPEHLRLHVYQNELEETDAWEDFVDATGLLESTKSKHYQYLERAEERWKAFARSRRTHPALCSPSDAEGYAAHLSEERNLGVSSAAKYWSSIERFYRWMFHHAEYPHRYSPFLIAAVNDDLCHRLWMHAIDKQ
ncbi:hypothetical protein [Haloglomus salinum]|uniref:hypothetical protein n=1 Tax=Haloglomus salinum TaxID=2962673 RepID=UPI0020C97FC7|nr:hypothetical protein [Haloglomus salinum]